MFFHVLFEKNEYIEKEFLLNEEHSKDLFLNNLSSLLTEKELFLIKTKEILKKYRNKNYKLNFKSDAEIFSYIKTFQSSQVKNSFFLMKIMIFMNKFTIFYLFLLIINSL